VKLSLVKYGHEWTVNMLSFAWEQLDGKVTNTLREALMLEDPIATEDTVHPDVVVKKFTRIGVREQRY